MEKYSKKNIPKSGINQKENYIMMQKKPNILPIHYGNSSRNFQSNLKKDDKYEKGSLKNNLNLLNQKRKDRKYPSTRMDNKNILKIDDGSIENFNLNNHKKFKLITKKYDKEKDKLKEQNNELKSIVIKLNETLDKTNEIIPNMVQNIKNQHQEERGKLKLRSDEEELKSLIQKENDLLKEKVINIEQEKDGHIKINNSLKNQIMQLNSKNYESTQNYLKEINELNNKIKKLENDNDEFKKKN